MKHAWRKGSYRGRRSGGTPGPSSTSAWEQHSRRPQEDHQERRGVGHAGETPFVGCVRALPVFGPVRMAVGGVRGLFDRGQEGGAGGLVELVQRTVSPVAQEQRSHEQQRDEPSPRPRNGNRSGESDSCHLAQFTSLSAAFLIPRGGIYIVSYSTRLVKGVGLLVLGRDGPCLIHERPRRGVLGSCGAS